MKTESKPDLFKVQLKDGMKILLQLLNATANYASYFFMFVFILKSLNITNDYMRYFATTPWQNILFWVLLLHLIGLITRDRHTGAKGVPAVAMAIRSELSSPADIKTTCVHEAGHALLIAALDKVPQSTVITCHERAIEGILGQVKMEGHLLTSTLTMKQWHMHMCLAGKIAEEVLIGEDSLMCNEDMRQWEAVAKEFLACNGGEYFYQSPTANESESNRMVLSRLLIGQRTVVRAFLIANLEPLKTIAATLEAQRTIKADELAPLLSKVDILDGIPLPNAQTLA